MTILSFFEGSTGQVGYEPTDIYISCNDDLETITTAGYLSGIQAQGFTIDRKDIVNVIYGSDNDTYGTFIPSIDGTTVSLVPFWVQNEDNDTVISWNNVQAGDSGVAGSLISYPETAAKGSLALTAVDNSGDYAVVISNAAMGQASTISIPDPGASTASFLLNTSSGGQVISGGLTVSTGNLAVSQGNITAGSSGHAGTVSSFPSTSAKGSLKLAAVANSGDTITTISNVAMGQASIVSIPDPAAATANFVVAPAALVSGNLVKASGTAGLVVDAGARIIANTTGTYAGGGTSNTFTATGLTVGCKGTAVIRASTNSVAITKALPGTDSLAITFSADPGANTTVDYIYVTASQA